MKFYKQESLSSWSYWQRSWAHIRSTNPISDHSYMLSIFSFNIQLILLFVSYSDKVRNIELNGYLLELQHYVNFVISAMTIKCCSLNSIHSHFFFCCCILQTLLSYLIIDQTWYSYIRAKHFLVIYHIIWNHFCTRYLRHVLQYTDCFSNQMRCFSPINKIHPFFIYILWNFIKS